MIMVFIETINEIRNYISVCKNLKDSGVGAKIHLLLKRLICAKHN